MQSAYKALRSLQQLHGPPCPSCGRPMWREAARSLSKRAGHAPAATAKPAPGNPEVMRRFQALQAGLEAFDGDDDFMTAPSAAHPAAGSEAVAGSHARAGNGGAQPGPPAGELPPARFRRVNDAKYVGSAVDLTGCPPPTLPEFAVVGRSNVGKSSLINMLTGSKGLALVSKQPGKTRAINHFLVDRAWYLVDLPGYGYAKRSYEDRDRWNAFTKEFFSRRETLVCVSLLVDASVPCQEYDVECAVWLHQNGVPFNLVFTKADKADKGKRKGRRRAGGKQQDAVSQCLDRVAAQVGYVPDAFLTSASEASGAGDVLGHMSSLMQQWEARRST